MDFNEEHISHLDNIINGGLMKKVTPSHIESHFLQHGYVRKAIGGLVVTETGYKTLIDWNKKK